MNQTICLTPESELVLVQCRQAVQASSHLQKYQKTMAVAMRQTCCICQSDALRTLGSHCVNFLVLGVSKRFLRSLFLQTDTLLRQRDPDGPFIGEIASVSLDGFGELGTVFFDAFLRESG